ncbi:MAG: insulinase family protein [Ruminococcus sp.]|nr:insulinase family protein [Ruminococcus sp.]
MNYKRTELGRNIGFTSITDEKFKTCSVYVRFVTPLVPAEAAANSLGTGVLSASNSKLRSIAELNEKLSALYGSALGTFTRKRGDIQILGLTASWICSRYALEGEDIEGEMLDLVRDCLFSPNVQNGEFDATTFRITKNDLLDHIDSEMNNKRSYALERASEIAFAGEPAECPCYSTREAAEAVTASEAYAAYKKLMSTALVEIYYVAPEPNDKAAEMFRREFAAIERRSQECSFRTVSPVKPEPVTVTETMDVLQCKTVLTFKSNSDDIYALRILSALLGETPVSKLFVNVREKLSLCYYCSCSYNDAKNTLTVDSGTEKESIEAAEQEILRQLDEIRNGNITDNELENAFLSKDNMLAAVGDTPSSYSSWYFSRFCIGSYIEPQQQAELYRGVTKERVTAAAQSLRLDSRYIMLCREDNS